MIFSDLKTFNMKIIGLIGGLGPEATTEYYNDLINTFKNETGDLNYPEIIIYSVNMSVFIGLMKENKYEEAANLLVSKIDALHKAGAEFAAITANTPHLMFNEIKERSRLPLISIVEATRDQCEKMGLRRAGLLGTGFTMNADFYQTSFSEKGIKVVLPDEEDKQIINTKLFSEIELGIFKDETRQLLESIIGKMKNEKRIDSVIMGCTELPLILKEDTYSGLPSLNTTKIHAKAIADFCISAG